MIDDPFSISFRLSHAIFLDIYYKTIPLDYNIFLSFL